MRPYEPADSDTNRTRSTRARGRSALLPEKLIQFLEILSHTGNVSLSARRIGMSRSTIYAFAAENPSFKTAMKEAMTEGRELLVGEAWRRATTWTERFELDEHGNPTGPATQVIPPSDRLLAILIQGYFQEFKPGQREAQTPDELLPEDADLTKLSNEELTTLERMIEKATATDEVGARTD